MEYVADFETTTDVNDCRVWAWAVCEIGNPDRIDYGNSIETFLMYCKEHGGVYYFHNAAFDCEFIMWNLLESGYTHVDHKLGERTFKTLISGTGKFYSMQVCFERRGKRMKKAEFKDSLKKLPLSVAAIAKAFHLPIMKLEIDYTEYRAPGHELTALEKEYIKNDVQIVAMALQVQFDKGLQRLTIGSDALNEYKDMIALDWKRLFPTLPVEMDSLIRKAYRGGWTYANPKFQADDKHPDRCIGCGSVYDVNSLYPDVMYNCDLPVGVPKYFHGEYAANVDYPLHIQFLACACQLKPGHLPTLQIKHNPFFCETEYVTDTHGVVELALTNVDLELLCEHYDVDVFAWRGGFMFKSAQGVFKDYIDKWMHVKETTTGGERQLAKLMLNSLYGKFATNPDVTGEIPYLKGDESVGYKLGKPELRDPVYTAMGCFITANARKKTITAAQSVYDRFLYADTDSVHVLGCEPVKGMDVHPTRLGAWKHESDFCKAKYVRAKTYIERITAHGILKDGQPAMEECEPYDDVKCAGMPKELKGRVTFDNFKRGLKLDGKLRPKHCKGGVVLVPTTFTMT